MISLNLANILTNIAEVKKSKPENKEKVLALMMAARTLRDDQETIDMIIRGEGRDKLVGIDSYCYGLIKEYLEKGTIEEYEQFVSRYSEDLVKFIRITGLGKKRIFAIYDHFNIRDFRGLKEVFGNKKGSFDLTGNSGLDKDTLNPLFLERIQRSLKYYESLEGKTPRWPVEFFAKTIIKTLDGLKDIERARLVGSIRRKKILVGDIDVLVLPRFNGKAYDFGRSKKLLEDIEKLPTIKRLVSIKKDARYISASYRTIYEIDMEVIIAGRRSWSWQLFKTTGNKGHLNKLEKYAMGKGLWKTDGRESGFEIDPGDRTGSFIYDANSEEEIYRLLGLEYIPPELRQGRDEIELSRQGRLPELVRPDDIKGDLHIHSQWSDGLISYKDMIDIAKRKNYQYIAISDHSISNFYGNGLSTERLLQKIDFIKDLRKEYKDINILMGAEIDIRKADKFDYPPEIIKKLDLAIASLHSSFTNSREENTSRVVSALGKDYFDLLAHPTGFVFGNRAPIFIDMDRVIEVSAKYGKALEINSYYMRMDLNEENVRKARDAGAKLAVNTDSHRPGNMDMIRFGVDLARRAGLEPKDIINTFTLDELRSWRKDRNNN